MSSKRIVSAPVGLHQTVEVICTLIEKRLAEAKRAPKLTEKHCRDELVACMLSSQVRFETSNLAFERLQTNGLLSNARWRASDDGFERDLSAALADSNTCADQRSAYRFPQMRSRQIATLRECLRGEPLLSRIEHQKDVKHIRARLVENLPGIGPKQASMLLRNLGVSYDVAILDTHVLEFFRSIGVLPRTNVSVSTIKHYETTEAIASRFAEGIGYRVGLLDWAIWITMRAARELRL